MQHQQQQLQKQIRQQQLEHEAMHRYVNVALTVDTIYPMSKDQLGCRYLQQILDRQDAGMLDVIYQGLLPHFAQTMAGAFNLFQNCLKFKFIVDPFGNYLAQKVIELCSPHQRAQVIDSAGSHLVDAAMSPHGTRSLQRLIELLQTVQNVPDFYSVCLIKDGEDVEGRSTGTCPAYDGRQWKSCRAENVDTFRCAAQSSHL
jgi:hypothetical protein